MRKCSISLTDVEKELNEELLIELAHAVVDPGKSSPPFARSANFTAWSRNHITSCSCQRSFPLYKSSTNSRVVERHVGDIPGTVVVHAANAAAADTAMVRAGRPVRFALHTHRPVRVFLRSQNAKCVSKCPEQPPLSVKLLRNERFAVAF